MIKYFRYLFVAIATICAVGCIKNDIPYPVQKLDIISMDVEGLKSSPEIVASSKSVALELEETTDIRKVRINSVELTEGAESNVKFPATFDLRTPLYVTLSKYQSYEWTISALQTIERYFKIEGQIGESKIDAEHHIVTAYVPMDYDLTNVVITEFKLGPKDISTYSPAVEELTNFDGTARYVEVSYHGDITERWTIIVEKRDMEVEFTAVDAWAKRIWLYANGRADSELGFKYRKSGDQEWIEVENVNIDGGSFKACVEGLETLTSYDVMAYSNENVTEVVTVTTENTFELPNAGFEEWSFSNKCYWPYSEGATPFWGTGNPGATSLGDQFNLTTPYADEVRPGSEGTTSAKLQSMFPNMAGVGKFAAGNMFLGRFAGTFGTNGVVHFGRSCTARPVALHGWYKYTCGTIDKVGKVPSSRPDIAIGSPDEGQILVAVGSWDPAEYGGDEDSPVAIDTRDESTFFSTKSDAIIGVGEILLTESTDGWVEFTLPIEYKSTSEIPTHLIVVFTGSHFGDYFTGSTQTCMLVDDLELVY